jgi:site-specific recombinase XerD
MVTGGIDLVTVKEILGHSKIEMTMRYAHPTLENKRKAVAVLESIFGKKHGTNMAQTENSIEVKKPLVS